MILDPKKEIIVKSSELNSLSRIVGTRLITSRLSAPEKNIGTAYGGGKFFSTSGGSCTTGFNVANASGNASAVTTAGHCSDSGLYYANWYESTSPFYVTFNLQNTSAQYNDSERDFQINSVTNGNYVTGLYFGSSSSEMFGKSPQKIRTRSTTIIGQQVCHRGLTSGDSCGEIWSVHYTPAIGNCGSQPCSDTWIGVKGADLACASGDSGGPFFFEDFAFGMAKSASALGTDKGQCQIITYMSVDYVIAAGFTILK